MSLGITQFKATASQKLSCFEERQLVSLPAEDGADHSLGRGL